MDFTVVRSSAGRGWSGFDATLYHTSAGIDDTRFATDCVSMHVGPPARAAVRCDGTLVRGYRQAGDLKIIPAGYSRIWEVDRPALKFSIRLHPELVRTAAERLPARREVGALSPMLAIRDPRVEHIIWALHAELASDDVPSDRIFTESLGMALAVHVVRLSSDTDANARAHASQRGLAPAALRRVLEYVAEHRTSDVGLCELAHVAGVSASHFTVLFKRSVGTSVHRYLVQRRLEYAIELLARSELSLCEVALGAGFASQSHLAAWMRRLHGTTPAAYRRADRAILPAIVRT